MKNNPDKTQALKTQRIHRGIAFILLAGMLMLTMACFGGDDTATITGERVNDIKTRFASINEPESSESEEEATAAVPTYEPVDSGPIIQTNGMHEYSVAAESYSCTCQETGNITQELKVVDGKLEITNPGGEPQVFEQIGQNVYEKNWMGYAILIDNGTETREPREESVIITLTTNGYIVEHYSGGANSPCCSYTFTQVE